MSELNRRSFLKNSTAAAVGASVLSAASITRAAQRPNETIRVAVIGVRGRGGSHIKGFEAQPGVEIAALCDVDEQVLSKRVAGVEKKTKRKIQRYTDLREVMDRKDIDVVSIATPNHWHSLAGIWACQAGKDIYVEKPCSHNVSEGRKLVQAARKYKRIVQHGTQIRSSVAIREGIRKLHEGVIGDVYMARGLCYRWRDTIGKTPDEATPSYVHYDTWLGPAPKRPFSRNRFHYNWHWNFAYGNGDIGNQGVHQMDVARWGLGVGLPKRAQAMGGHYLFDDDQNTPNAVVATFEYPEENKMLVFDVRPWMTNDEQGAKVGVLFYGSEGYMAIPSYSKYETFLGKKREPGPSNDQGGDHFANFVKAVRSRKVEDLHADIEQGHLSAALCHLANDSYKLGRSLSFDPVKETYLGDEAATKLLTRDYRAPFVVPKTV